MRVIRELISDSIVYRCQVRTHSVHNDHWLICLFFVLGLERNILASCWKQKSPLFMSACRFREIKQMYKGNGQDLPFRYRLGQHLWTKSFIASSDVWMCGLPCLGHALSLAGPCWSLLYGLITAVGMWNRIFTIVSASEWSLKPSFCSEHVSKSAVSMTYAQLVCL